MKWALKITGASACLVAVLVMVGGHWLALQSVAWTTMLVKYSQGEGLWKALAKTFDGDHPCNLCLKVRAGIHEDRQKEAHLPLVKSENLPACLWEFRTAVLPPHPTQTPEQHAIVPHLHSDFVETPPSPPPRG